MAEEGFYAAEERRASTRFRKDRSWDKAIVHWLDGKSILADVHNESLGGISLFLTELRNLEVDHVVEIEFAGETRQSRVCHIQPQDGGGFIIGFDCRSGTCTETFSP